MDDRAGERSDLPLLSDEMSRFIENIALYYEGHGQSRIAGRIFGLMLVTTTPLSAEQIGQLLQASLGSVSTNVRALVAAGWIEKVTFPGTRTTYYRFAPSAWDSVMERRRQSIAPLKKMAGQIEAALPPDHPARDQIHLMAEWADLIMDHYEGLKETWKARVAEQQPKKQPKS